MIKGLRLAAALLLSALAAGAVDWKTLKPQGYVSDFAGVIDAPAKSRLEQYLAAAQGATGAQIALVTLPSLQGEPIEDVANTLFRAWGVGQKGQNNGVLILFAIGDRRDRVEVGYGLEPILTDGAVGSILRQVRPLLAKQQYGAAMMDAAQEIGGRIAEAKHVAIPAELPRPPRPSPMDSIPWPLAIGGLILLVWLIRLFRSQDSRPGSYRRGGGGFWPGGVFDARPTPITWGGMGGGGFGGPDSGDSFGGFGGGDSGGGGASSSW
jgi:uncharacterized protein